MGGREDCAETGLNTRQLRYDIVKLTGSQALHALEFADELAASAEGMTALLIDRLAQNLKTILGANGNLDAMMLYTAEKREYALTPSLTVSGITLITDMNSPRLAKPRSISALASAA